MTEMLSAAATMAMKIGLVALIANEVRGFVMAVPILYAMYLAGGTGMALWIGFCSLCGIALSALVPVYLARRLKLLPAV